MMSVSSVTNTTSPGNPLVLEIYVSIKVIIIAQEYVLVDLCSAYFVISKSIYD